MPPTSVVIDNPIINSPFVEPRRHFRFDDNGITDQIVGERRPSSYFIPITCDLCDAQAQGYISRVPHYNTALKYIEKLVLVISDFKRPIPRHDLMTLSGELAAAYAGLDVRPWDIVPTSTKCWRSCQGGSGIGRSRLSSCRWIFNDSLTAATNRSG